MGEVNSTTVLTLEDIQGNLSEEERIQIFANNDRPYFVKTLRSQDAKINEPFVFTVQGMKSIFHLYFIYYKLRLYLSTRYVC